MSARLALALGATLLTGCVGTDPYTKAGAWQPTGANIRNLAAMIEQPKDLIRGRGARGNDGWEAQPPVARLWSGKVTPLPSGASQSGPGGPAAAPAANGPGGA